MKTCLIDYTTWLLCSGNAQSRVDFGVAPSPVRGRNLDVYWDWATAKVEAHSCREVMTCVSEVVFGHWPQQDPFGMCQGCGGACCVLWQRLKSTGTDGGFEKGAAVGCGGLSPYSVRYLSALALMRVARDACSA